jgi:hypothetical protein
MAATATKAQGKTGFVKEFLNDHPQANTKAVNEAWTADGMSGTISPSLVKQVRSELGLTGNLRARPKSSLGTKTRPSTTTPRTTGAKRGRKPKAVSSEVSTRTATARKTGSQVQPSRSRNNFLDEVEADLDRLIFKLMGISDLAGIEENLRQTRRLLSRHFPGGSR